MRVFLDLDLVLVNVFPLWQSEWNQPIAAQLGMRPEDVYAVGEAIWTRGDLYTPVQHLRELGLDPFSDWSVQLRRAFESLVRSGQINYEDTKSFLSVLAKRRLRRSILSFGDAAYQMLKVEGLQTHRGFFEELDFTSRSRQKAQVLQRALRAEPDDPIVMLDDSCTELAEIALRTPRVRRIQVRRTSDIPVSEHADVVVSDLTTALEVLS